MTEPLQRTTLQMADLAEQKDRSYIFLPPEGTGIGPITIDSWDITSNVVTGLVWDGPSGLQQKIPVVCMPVRGDWRIILNALTSRITYEESLRLKAQAMKAGETLEKELFPDLADKLKAAMGMPTMGEPGQYL